MQSLKNNISNRLDKINLLGVNITRASQAEVRARIQEFLDGRRQHVIVTPNPEIILQAIDRDEELWYILNHADLALADGVALKFAAWFYGKNIKRITGADLTVDILKSAQARKYKVAVFNRQRGLSGAEEIKSALNKKFPELKVYVQAVEQPPQTERQHSDEMLSVAPGVTSSMTVLARSDGRLDFRDVNQFAPDIVFCALGSPGQEKFIYYNLPKIPSARLGMSIGGSFDFLTGKARRAPKLLRRIGLEWFWRLANQPKRVKRIYRATVIFPFRFFVFFFILRWFYRSNVACLLYKKVQAADGKASYKILIVERVGDRGHWQLPQGGTGGESLSVAGARELSEELNTRNFKPMAVFENLFKYKFDARLDKDGLKTSYQPMKNQRGYKGQKQSLFIAEFVGTDGEIMVNLWEHSAWRWVKAKKLVESLHPVRREAAKIFMEKFWETVSSLSLRA